MTTTEEADMGLLKPTPVEKARMRELSEAIEHAESLGVRSEDDHEARAAQARIRRAEEDLGPVHRWIARDRTR
ncbi:hypothetical protein GCM10010156_77020 [Planobispora rosea]|uniref:Uncharacterized protein n=1 Tax=Planobispora rosea TaxID=35762 RepID=A0A8J3SG97_PLARO|nr:hypothetical protein [Planobispora rosea]GGT08656.1 hypothetical protein GCM10010156_77020 [Planobispora rosea]GIH89143.1 hypothetical protein Pro02_75510 [Planobispora rosea]